MQHKVVRGRRRIITSVRIRTLAGLSVEASAEQVVASVEQVVASVEQVVASFDHPSFDHLVA